MVYSTVLYIIVQYITILYIIVQNITVLYIIVQYSTVLYSIVVYRTVLFPVYCTVYFTQDFSLVVRSVKNDPLLILAVSVSSWLGQLSEHIVTEHGAGMN